MIIPMVMGVEESLDGRYWAIAVVEEESGPFTDNNNNYWANICWFCGEGNGKWQTTSEYVILLKPYKIIQDETEMLKYWGKNHHILKCVSEWRRSSAVLNQCQGES